VNAVLRNKLSDLHVGQTLLGFEFVAQGEIDETGQLKWEPLRSGEFSKLGPYVFKWNLLDFYKDRNLN